MWVDEQRLVLLAGFSFSSFGGGGEYAASLQAAADAASPIAASHSTGIFIFAGRHPRMMRVRGAVTGRNVGKQLDE